MEIEWRKVHPLWANSVGNEGLSIYVVAMSEDVVEHWALLIDGELVGQADQRALQEFKKKFL